MKINRQKVGTVEVLAPVGPLVDDDAKQFGKMLLERVKSANPRLVVALKEVPVLDSAALEALLDAAERLSALATTLKLAELTPTCREVLELTGLSPRFRLFNETQDAVRSFL